MLKTRKAFVPDAIEALLLFIGAAHLKMETVAACVEVNNGGGLFSSENSACSGHALSASANDPALLKAFARAMQGRLKRQKLGRPSDGQTSIGQKL
jgi:hypothetical protein